MTDQDLQELEVDGRRYLMQRGVVDGRSILAFSNGHCHSLALALRNATGGELVAFRRHQEPFDHVLCRLDDERLADIGGARTGEQIVRRGGQLGSTDKETLMALPERFKWAQPDPGMAEPWVKPVLELATANAEYQQVPLLSCRRVDERRGLLIHFEWSGDHGGVTINGFARGTVNTSKRWAHVLDMGVPKDARGIRTIDFTARALADHADLATECFGQVMAERVTTPISPLQPAAASS
jgi:hypothetical protein